MECKDGGGGSKDFMIGTAIVGCSTTPTVAMESVGASMETDCGVEAALAGEVVVAATKEEEPSPSNSN